ncbi:MAG: RluA family pseudouridine synthase [Lachnospiraceae bacterium]|nr:RluA family pseudouridine synthase [Lachnospiraceae bacterium]
MKIRSTMKQGIRIDRYLSQEYPDHSRSYLQKLIKDGNVLVNQRAVKPNYKLSEEDEITVEIPEPKEVDIIAEPVPLDIIYEDADIIILNKQKDMVVHPCPGHYSGTLVNGLLYHCKGQLSGINGELRPGIVHRIDKDTTGLLVICKNDYAHNFIAEQLKVHSITRKYHAIVHHNLLEDEGSIEAPVGRNPNDRKKMAVNDKNGKRAVTHYKVLERLQNQYTYIECSLETGRTHQIRVHMSHIHHPLVGDEVYGPKKSPFSLQGQCLHAKVLGFIHPTTKQYVEFDSPLPQYFEQLLEKLR